MKLIWSKALDNTKIIDLHEQQFFNRMFIEVKQTQHHHLRASLGT